MATKTKPGAFSKIVDVDAGHISREIFVNEDIYRQEQEQIFAQGWLFVGHESQVAKPGRPTPLSGRGDGRIAKPRPGKLPTPPPAPTTSVHTFLCLDCIKRDGMCVLGGSLSIAHTDGSV